VDGAKDTAEQVLRMGILFQLDQVVVELIQVFVAFNEKFFYDFIHRRLPIRTRWRGDIVVTALARSPAWSVT
jgi:4-hydroxyphenylpyruvate dioxygenase-like putative hemolysin